MEGNEDKPITKRNGFSSLNIKNNITVLDLCNKNIADIDENIELPVNLTELYLAHNKFTKVPDTLLKLTKIKVLDVSFNEIEYFDGSPNFCDTIEHLNISNNKLLGPPYWIWTEQTKNLREINLSCNRNITYSFVNGYFEELLKHKTPVTNIILYNCALKNHLKLLSTFPKVKELVLGTEDLNLTSHKNYVEDVPCVGLDECYNVEKLNLTNTGIFSINFNIVMYKYIKEIDLSLNKLSCLPTEFCCLENLEVCILSSNNLLYLPDNFNKLEKLAALYLHSNVLCMLPENLYKIPCLRKLDLYDNNLYDIPDVEMLSEVDLAQNYFEEPVNEEYVKKKEKFRSKNPERIDGRKLEVEKPESDYSKDDEDEFLLSSECDKEDMQNISFSSEEDWDSDDYWIPHFTQYPTLPQSPWLIYVKRKMADGNFCPMDAHQVSVFDKVKYEKQCNPKVQYESDGQFDDFSGDDS